MARRRRLHPKPLLDEQLLRTCFDTNGIKPTHAKKCWAHLIRNPGASISEIPGLPAAAYSVLETEFAVQTSKVKTEQHSSDGTIKLLIELQDGLDVEAVVMVYDPSTRTESHQAKKPGKKKAAAGHRATLCVSSQVGCKMGCSFCATGTMGLLGDLTGGEILEQLVHAQAASKLPIRNVVFMGMGEPLNNYDNVVSACRAMSDPSLFGLAPSHLTVSTVGVVPRMLSLATDLPRVNLALSLHAPNQDLRATIMPAARPFPLDKLLAGLEEYHARTGRKALVQYIMLGGVNDQLSHAHELGALLKGRPYIAVVNLIPYNPTGVEATFEATGAADVTAFQEVVRLEYGINTTVRQEMGQDISGACGQLVIDSKSNKSTGASQMLAGGSKTADRKELVDIEDLKVPIGTNN